MALKAGTIEDYDYSMAADMENAFMSEWPHVMGGQKAPDPNAQMRLLFIAMAQGVIRHLKNHTDGFTVTVSDGMGNQFPVAININTNGDLF